MVRYLLTVLLALPLAATAQEATPTVTETPSVEASASDPPVTDTSVPDTPTTAPDAETAATETPDPSAPLASSSEDGAEAATAPAEVVDAAVDEATETVAPEGEPAQATEAAVTPTDPTPAISVETNAAGQETVVMLSDVLFGFGEARIRPEAEDVLREAAEEIAGNSGVIIEGHTDDIGSEAFNLALGQARAEAVRNWLVSAGLDASAFETVSKGESDPKVPNRTAETGDLPENRALNRRVVFVLPSEQ